MTEKTDVEPPSRVRTILKGCALAAGLVAAVTILSAGFGILVGLYTVLTADGGESIDPSQKARILGESISEAMNCTAFAFLVLAPVAVVVGVWWWRRSVGADKGENGVVEAVETDVKAGAVEEVGAEVLELHGTEAIRYATNRLKKVNVDANNWVIEYVDEANGDAWVMDYPQSELHGGGSPRLRRKDKVPGGTAER